MVGIVRRFSNAFKTVTGQNEVRKMLRTILWLKYKIKDNSGSFQIFRPDLLGVVATVWGICDKGAS